MLPHLTHGARVTTERRHAKVVSVGEPGDRDQATTRPAAARSSSGPTCCARSPAASPASSTRSGRASRWPMAAARSACRLLPQHRHRPPRPLPRRPVRPHPHSRRPGRRPRQQWPRPPRPRAPHHPRRGALRLRRARAAHARPPRDPRRRAPAGAAPWGRPEGRSPGTAEVGSPGSAEGRPPGPAEGRPCRSRRQASVVVEAVPQRPRLLPTTDSGRTGGSVHPEHAFDSMR